MKYKIVAAIPCKNEEWIVDKSLKILSKFCDRIIMRDDGSTDKTKEICISYDKVEWSERPYHVWWKREESKHYQELIELVKPHNPDYVFFTDCDEIPTSNIINFFENIDESVNLWSSVMINLWLNENHYRIDRFRNSRGSNINWDPFSSDAWRKKELMKYDKNIDYKYDITQERTCGINHPAPINVPFPHSITNDFYVLHYGKINPFYVCGEKDKMYAKMDEFAGRGNYNERLEHHRCARVEGNPILKDVSKEWFW